MKAPEPDKGDSGGEQELEQEALAADGGEGGMRHQYEALKLRNRKKATTDQGEGRFRTSCSAQSTCALDLGLGGGGTRPC